MGFFYLGGTRRNSSLQPTHPTDEGDSIPAPAGKQVEADQALHPRNHGCFQHFDSAVHRLPIHRSMVCGACRRQSYTDGDPGEHAALSNVGAQTVHRIALDVFSILSRSLVRALRLQSLADTLDALASRCSIYID